MKRANEPGSDYDSLTYECKYVLMDGCMDGRMDVCMFVWMYGCMEGWMDDWMDGWMDGDMCVCMYKKCKTKSVKQKVFNKKCESKSVKQVL